MQYVVLADGQELALDVEADGSENSYSVTLGDESFTAQALFLPDGQISLLLGDEHFLVCPTSAGAQVRGAHVDAEVLDLREMALRRARAQSEGEEGPSDVTAPMTGRVARVLVAEGQTVEAGEGLVVIEAMKMENELRAPKTGIVSALSCRPEALVELGALVCRVD